MDCKEVKNQLSDYIDGGLSEEATEQVARHLDSCPGCKEAYEDMTRLVGFMQEMDTIDEPADLVRNVRARLEKTPSLWDRARELFAAPAFRVPAAAAVLAAALLLVLYVPTHRDTGMIMETPRAPKDAMRRELAEEPPVAAEEPPAVMEDKLAAVAEEPGTVAMDVEREELAQEARKRSEAEVGKEGLAVTSGRTADEQPARGAVEDAPEQVPAEKKTDALASMSKEEFAAGEGAPEPEPESVSDVDIVAANKAAPMPTLVPAFDDTVAIAATDEQLLFAAVDSAGGEITQSFYDDEKRLTALVVELPRDRYESFLQRLGAERSESSIRLLSAVGETEAESRRQAPPDVRTIIVRVEIRR
jgi:hypothetical protein